MRLFIDLIVVLSVLIVALFSVMVLIISVSIATDEGIVADVINSKVSTAVERAINE